MPQRNDYAVVQASNGQTTPAMNFTVQEHIQVLSGALFSAGAPQGPNPSGFSGYLDYISGTATRNTLQTFTASGGWLTLARRRIWVPDPGFRRVRV